MLCSQFPELSKRRAMRQQGGVFEDWVVGLTPFGRTFGTGDTFEAYSRILKEGKAKEVYKITLPFDPEKTKRMRLTHIFSEPSIFKTDPAFQQYALDWNYRSGGGTTRILSYFYILEKLFQVSFSSFTAICKR